MSLSIHEKGERSARRALPAEDRWKLIPGRDSGRADRYRQAAFSSSCTICQTSLVALPPLPEVVVDPVLLLPELEPVLLVVPVLLPPVQPPWPPLPLVVCDVFHTEPPLPPLPVAPELPELAAASQWAAPRMAMLVHDERSPPVEPELPERPPAPPVLVLVLLAPLPLPPTPPLPVDVRDWFALVDPAEEFPPWVAEPA